MHLRIPRFTNMAGLLARTIPHTRTFTFAFLLLTTTSLPMFIPIASATEPEETYGALPGWVPAGGLMDTDVNDTNHKQHGAWHGITDYLTHEAFHAGGGGDRYGKNFLNFHTEYIGRFDDYRLTTNIPTTTNPFPAIVALVPDAGSTIQPEHTSLNVFFREPIHDISVGGHAHGGGGPGALPARPANLKLGNADFHNLADSYAIGHLIDSGWHGLTHVRIGTHDGGFGDMASTDTAPRDAAFFQWHKQVDNVYADWAVGQYRKQNNSGTPVFFSVDNDPTGLAGTTVRERGGPGAADAYKPVETTAGPTDNSEYGAKPRVASDIYVADNDGQNLRFQYGITGWNIDAYSDLNASRGDSVYYSLAPGSTGKPGTAVRTHANATHVAADAFRSLATGTNTAFRTEAQLGLAGADNQDSLEVDFARVVQATNDDNTAGIHHRPRQFFSLESDSIGTQQAYTGAAISRVVRPADVLHYAGDGKLTVVLRFDGDLGLQANDELDALFIFDKNTSNSLDNGDDVYFSLDAGSPSLAAFSPADIFTHSVGTSGFSRFLTADQLGLLASDNIDALDHVVPEPSACWILVVGALASIIVRSRRTV